MNSQLLPFDEALARLLAETPEIEGIERVGVAEAGGRILAEDLHSGLDVPTLDNAQMDGYAVRSAELAAASPDAPVRLPVAQRIVAGQIGAPLVEGTVARIFTGAPIPEGADAVVMQEAVDVQDDDASFTRPVAPGEWIRRAGEDIRAGTVILPAGTRLSPQAAGLAASVGLAQLPVKRRLRVACFFTGDELARPGEPLRPGAVYDSNRPMLVGLLRRFGCEVSDLGNVPDSLEATREALRAAAVDNDLIVSSGGMSVGEEDYVRAAVQAEGELTLWQIAIKPGKPLACGRLRRAGMSAAALAASALSGIPMAVPAALPGDAQFIGLPGNPVSAFATFLLFVRPLMLRMLGANGLAPPAVRLEAGFDWPSPDPRREFLRARLDAKGRLELYPNQGSGVLTSTVWADGLIDNPAGQVIRRGDQVRFLPYTGLFD